MGAIIYFFHISLHVHCTDMEVVQENKSLFISYLIVRTKNSNNRLFRATKSKAQYEACLNCLGFIDIKQVPEFISSKESNVIFRTNQ